MANRICASCKHRILQLLREEGEGAEFKTSAMAEAGLCGNNKGVGEDE